MLLLHLWKYWTMLRTPMVSPRSQIETILIFIDAATSAKAKIAVGIFLCLAQAYFEHYAKMTPEILPKKLADFVVFKQYISKKSTWSEIKTVIDALYAVMKKYGPGHKIEIFTDCQSLCDLLSRRKEKLIKNNFITKSGIPLQNADLYAELFAIADRFQIMTFKIKGHDSIANRLNLHEKVFAMLDNLSRKKLRSILNNDESQS